MNRITNAALAGFAALILILAGYGLMAIADPAQGVYAKAAEPEPCVKVAVVGTVETWQCEDADGQPFLQNTAGFMLR